MRVGVSQTKYILKHFFKNDRLLKEDFSNKFLARGVQIMQNSEAIPVSKIRTVMNMMFSPGTALKNAVAQTPFYFSILVSAVAFGLFFLQTGLDLYRTGQQPIRFVIAIVFVGVAFGAVAVPAISTIIWSISKLFGCEKTVKWAISSFCLSYSGALVYCIIGILTSTFLGWRTAVAFGVTGVLWAIGPMIATIREMIGGKIMVCVMLATLMGTVVLFCWSFVGNY